MIFVHISKDSAAEVIDLESWTDVVQINLLTNTVFLFMISFLDPSSGLVLNSTSWAHSDMSTVEFLDNVVSSFTSEYSS